MPTSFITETLSEQQPQVLIFTSFEKVSKILTDQLKTKNIIVQTASINDVGSAEFVEKTAEADFYKIIWWEDAPNITEKNAKIFITFCREMKCLGYVVGHVPFQSSDSELEKVGRGLESLFLLIERRLPYLSYIAYRDIISDDVWSAGNIFYQHPQRFHLEHFSPLGIEAFCRQLVQLLFLPRGGQRKVIQGKERVESFLSTQKKQHLWKEIGTWKEVVIEDREVAKALMIRTAQREQSSPEAHLPTPVKPSIPLKKTDVLTPSLVNTEKKLIEKTKEEPKPKKEVLQTPTPQPLLRKVEIPLIEPPKINRSALVLGSLGKKNEVVPKKNVPIQSTEPVVLPLQKKEQPQLSKEEEKTRIYQRIDSLFTPIEKSSLKPVEKKEVKNVVAPKSIPISPKKRRVLTMILLCLVAVSLATVLFFVNWWGIVWAVQTADQYMDAKQPRAGTQKIVQIGANAFRTQLQLYKVLLSDQQLQTFDGVSSVVQQLVFVSEESEALVKQYEQLTTQILDSDASVEAIDSEAWQKVAANQDTLYKRLGVIEAHLKEFEKNQTLTKLSVSTQTQRSWLTAVSARRKELLISQQLVAVLPNVLGQTTVQTYAVLLQDHTQLLPLGGAARGVALVTFEKGKLQRVETIDASTITQELSDQEIAEFQSFERVSENLNTTQVAATVTELIKTIRGQEISGVVFVNSTILKTLLSELGTVTVGSPNEVVSAQNVQERMMSQKRNEKTDYSMFLTDLYKKTFEKYNQLVVSKKGSIHGVIIEGFQQGQNFIHVNDTQTQQIFQSLGWGGIALQPPCPSVLSQKNCKVSAVFKNDIVPAILNLDEIGEINTKLQTDVFFKENLPTVSQYNFLYEIASQQILIDQASRSSQIRLLIPKQAKVLRVTFDEKEIPLEELDMVVVGERLQLMVDVEFLLNTTQVLSVKFEENTPTYPYSYAVFVQKQPGIESQPTTIVFHYDKGFIPQVVAPDAKIKENEIAFDFSGNSHVFAGVKFR